MYPPQNRSQLKRKEPPVQEAENNLSPTVEQTSSQTQLVKFQRFQSAWDPTKIHSQTLFVLATKANKVISIQNSYYNVSIDLHIIYFYRFYREEDAHIINTQNCSSIPST